MIKPTRPRSHIMKDNCLIVMMVSKDLTVDVTCGADPISFRILSLDAAAAAAVGG